MVRHWFKSLMLAVLVMALAGIPVALAQTPDLPERIDIQHAGLFPEGIEWYADGGNFLVGSLSEGTIYAVQDDGTLTPFIQDDTLQSSVGIQVDESGGRLLVANTDRRPPEQRDATAPVISLVAYDLQSGDQLFVADLASAAPSDSHFANDVAVDDQGNAYVTDSFTPVIYQVTPDGQASVLVQDETFRSDQFGLNGIVYHPDGYLLVAKADSGQLFKVPLDNPQNFSEVTLDQPVNGADGMVLSDNGELFVVGRPQQVFAVTSDDNWQTATVQAAAQTESQGTTAALRDGEVYVVLAKLDQMGQDPPPDVFPIVHVPFGEG